MGLRNKLISMLGGTPQVKPVEAVPTSAPFEVRSTTVPVSSPQGQAIMAAMRSGNQAAILRALKSAGAMPEETAAPPSIEQAAREALGGDGVGDMLEWDKWDNDRRILAEDAPGWSVCRFYYRISMTQARGAFGVVKGDFGIWRMPFDVCDYDADETDDLRPILSNLTHLSSGMNLGCFADTATAIAASEAITSMDWAGVPPVTEENRSKWSDHVNLMKKTWRFHGFEYEHRRHAHNPNDGEMIPIWARRDVADGKPEKLS